MGLIRDFRSLLSLLTTLPVGYSDLDSATRAFHMVPLVGLLESLVISPILLLFTRINGLLASSVYVLLHVIVTGALHLDGFSDYSDVIGSRNSGEEALKILKDPRKGSFAIVAITVNLITSFGATTTLYSQVFAEHSLEAYIILPVILALVYVASAESMYLTLALSPVEPYEGIARSFSLNTRTRSKYLNYIIYFLLIAILTSTLTWTLGVKGITIGTLLVVTGIILPMLIARDASKRLGFANGDIAGFSFESTRVLCLINAALVLGL